MRFLSVFAAACSLPMLFANAPVKAADIAHGQTIFGQCRACHTVDKDGGNRVGPNLFGVVDRKVGSAPSYPYSKSYLELKEKGMTWTSDNILKYLDDPRAFMQSKTGDKDARSKMVFKLSKEADRRDVVAYLQSLK